jgi:Cytochrome c554 and c-prime
MQHHRITKVVFLVLVALLSAGLNYSRTQQPRRTWSPTRIPSNTTFVGKQTCAECHASKVASHAQTMMGRAMDTALDSEILRKHPRLSLHAGNYTYEIIRQGDQSIYSVTDKNGTLSMPIVYAFGQGKAGQTYVLQDKGVFYESRVSFYNEIQGLDFTIGVPRTQPESLMDAIGRVMPKDETLQCFSCHTTGAVKGGKLEQNGLVPGIGCEVCHGPGGEHIELTRKGEPGAGKIFNPGRLSGDDISQEFCAACHRSVEDVTILPRMGGLNNIRFQPYRIFSSKCYSDDRRISCIGCHNVHQPLEQDAASYDAKCNACHSPVKSQTQTSLPVCKVANKNCVSCHMPKTELPGSHTRFTDHRIRIVKPGEPYPN